LTKKRQRGRREERRAEALRRARRDQRLGGGSKAARERRRGEGAEAGEEHAPATEQVGHAAGEQQQAAGEEHVDRHDPLQVLVGEAQLVPDRGKRDVHDGDVQDDHELRGAEQRQRGPGAKAVG
jgi:hypothetical protein